MQPSFWPQSLVAELAALEAVLLIELGAALEAALVAVPPAVLLLELEAALEAVLEAALATALEAALEAALLAVLLLEVEAVLRLELEAALATVPEVTETVAVAVAAPARQRAGLPRQHAASRAPVLDPLRGVFSSTHPASLDTCAPRCWALLLAAASEPVALARMWPQLLAAALEPVALARMWPLLLAAASESVALMRPPAAHAHLRSSRCLRRLVARSPCWT